MAASTVMSTGGFDSSPLLVAVQLSSGLRQLRDPTAGLFVQLNQARPLPLLIDRACRPRRRLFQSDQGTSLQIVCIRFWNPWCALPIYALFQRQYGGRLVAVLQKLKKLRERLNSNWRERQKTECRTKGALGQKQTSH